MVMNFEDKNLIINYMKTKKKIKSKNKTKKKNCSPIGEEIKLNESTCLSAEVIQKIKQSFNKKNPEKKIKYRNPYKIIERLKMEKPNCESDICWLNEIEEENKRKEIIEVFYAPKAPKEWKKNPDEWLSNYDILDVLNQYEKKYQNFKVIGPTPINFDSTDIYNNDKCVWEDLCKFSLSSRDLSNKDKIGIIFNLAKQGETGTHWVSLFVDLKNKIVLYFDSNGDECPEEIKKLINRIKGEGKKKGIILKEIYNKMEHQQSNTECGMYSLYFIITMLEERINKKKIKNVNSLIKHFTKQRIPDEFVFKHRNIYFNE